MKKFSAVFVSAAVLSAALIGTLICAPSAAPAEADVGNYYSSITATSGTELLGQLHDLIVRTHTKYTSYDECRDYAETTDPALNGENGVLEFYTHETMTSFSGTKGTWNREHVWPQSLSNDLWGKSGAGSDMHHIRPSEGQLNNSRGNLKYGNVTNGTPQYSKTTSGANSELGGYSNSSTFMPLDNVKGDAARIVMYVYTHYNIGTNVGGTLNSQGSGTLPITNVISASSETAAFELLLEWNELDPVDEIERNRNEAVYQIQGNRNPFIDNESYANAIWGDGTAVGGGTGTGSGSGSGSGTGTTTETPSFHPLTEPQEGSYIMMMPNGGDNYATANLSSDTYYIDSTTNVANAAQYDLIEDTANDGWIIKQGSRFLEIKINNTHANPVFNNSQTAGKCWKWDSEHSIFYWEANSDQYFLGTRSDRNYTTIGGCAWQYVDQNHLAQLGTYGTSTGGGTQGGSTTGGGTQGGGTSTPTSGFNRLTQPQEGTYLLGMYVNGTYQYATMNFVKTYYIETVTDYSEAAQFVITKDGDQYVIKAGTKYLEVAVETGSDGNTHINVKYNDSRTAGKGWTWDSERGIFTWVEDSGTYWIGNYGTYTDSISAADVTKLDSSSYIAYFGTYGTSGGTSTGGGTQSGGTTGGNAGESSAPNDQGSAGNNAQGNADSSQNKEETPKKKGGCTSAIAAVGGFAMIACVAGVGLFLRRKH